MVLILVWSCLSLNEGGESGARLKHEQEVQGILESGKMGVWQGVPSHDTSPSRHGVALIYSVIFLASPSQTRGPCLLRVEESGGL